MAKILEHLHLLGYFVNDHHVLDQIIEEGPKNASFTHIVSWLTTELQVLNELESCVHPISGPEDASSFSVEVSSFLKDVYCPYTCLMEGPVSQRLVPKRNKEILLAFLCTELEAARISSKQRPSKAVHVKMQESGTAKELREALIALKFTKPPPNITPMQLFSKVESKVQEMIKANPESPATDTLFTGTLTERQFFALDKLQQQMHEEYATRRYMLEKRLGVTVESFNWSDRLKNKQVEIEKLYTARRKDLSADPDVGIPDLLAARKDLLMVEKTSSGSVRRNTRSSINDVIIGAVPDRGGRPEEQQPPPPEIPSWQKEAPRQGPSRSDSGYSVNKGARPGGNLGTGISGESSYGGSDRDRSSSHGYGRGGGGASAPLVSNFRGSHDNVAQYQRGRGRDHGESSNFRGSYQSNFHSGTSYGGAPPGANYSYQQPVQPIAHPYNPSPGAEMQTQFYVSGNVHLPDDYGVGIGGYSATGGNFQQFGTQGEQQQQQRGRFNRGRGRYDYSRRGRAYH